MATPHIQAEMGEVAKTVLMPGDPLRAKFIAETFLENPVQFNRVRNMFGFTGTYKGKEVSVMGSGMGIPSIGIYAHELYTVYGVDTIIRIGSTGAFKPDIDIYETVLVESAYSDSSYAKCKCGDDSDVMYPDPELNKKLEETAERLGIHILKGPIWSSDVFYYEEAVLPHVIQVAQERDLLCAEMESFGLFATAKALNKKAACMLTVSDNIVTHVETTHEEREKHLMDMVKISLEVL